MNKENGERALIISFVCAPARRVTVLRTELPHSVRSVSPGGDEGAALDSQGGRVLSVNPSGASRHLPHRGRHLTLPLPFVSKRKRKPVRCAEIMNFIDSLRGRKPKFLPLDY